MERIVLFSVLAVALILFVWNRWRYDLVALGALLAVGVAGVVPPEQMFTGFGHPAVIMVAAVLVLSRGLFNAGAVDSMARILAKVGDRPVAQVATLTGVVAVSSAFMNNVGALALLMPVAIWMSRRSGRSPSLLLMPLAFGSLLGGTVTLIGTPPNIIIAAARRDTGAPAFGMFDFLPVGASIVVVGVLFIALVGWRLTPRREKAASKGELFEITDYIGEVRIPEGNRYAGRTLHELVVAVQKDADIIVIGLFREGQRQQPPPTWEILRAGDVLLVEADPDSLKTLLDLTALELAKDLGTDKAEAGVRRRINLVEAVVTPGSPLVARTAVDLDLRQRFGLNVLAVARQGRRLRRRLREIRFAPGDILLLQGRAKAMQATLAEIGCVPLAARGVRLGRPRKILLATAVFVGTLTVSATGLLPVTIALVGGATFMVLVGLLSAREAYESLDLPVIVLLAAMIPLGDALETTGGAELIAEGLLSVALRTHPVATVALLMSATMLLSNVINNAAAAILTAPIAIGLAQGMGVSADPLLMTVGIGASCAFLTPVGHQSNALVMTPGGYAFGDYWRMGLPLSVLVVVTAVPMILWVWPL